MTLTNTLFLDFLMVPSSTIRPTTYHNRRWSVIVIPLPHPSTLRSPSHPSLPIPVAAAPLTLLPLSLTQSKEYFLLLQLFHLHPTTFLLIHLLRLLSFLLSYTQILAKLLHLSAILHPHLTAKALKNHLFRLCRVEMK